MSTTVALMQALLGAGATVEIAQLALEQALLAEADPMHWVAVHLGQTDTEMMRRAAHWLDLAFYPTIPVASGAALEPARPEMLRDIRMIRLPVLDREIAFAAPDFFGLVRLADAQAAGSDIRNRVCLIPPSALRDTLVEKSRGMLIDNARQNMARYWPYAAAQLDLTRPIRIGFSIGVIVLLVWLLAASATGDMVLVPLWIWLVAVPAILRVLALAEPQDVEPTSEAPIADADLPAYTILLPLRDEAHMVQQLHTHLSRLDYPAEKLQIIYVVEDRSPETIAAIRAHLNDARFSLIVVPDALPRTKPKALNFALPFCRGDFVVVYDAEDRPDPDQLRRALAAFRARPNVQCVQARLVIANGATRALPALFAGEYAALFTVLLPAYARWGIVMPLGGTSNHFRMDTLRRIGGWDAFNVTEDADLAVRLARKRMATATIASRTFEDAPTRLRPWLGQRTRWMKGWIQTFVVHNRRPRLLIREMGLVGALMFQIIILGMLLGPLLHAGYMLLILGKLTVGQPVLPTLHAWPATCLAVLLVGYGTAILTNIIGLKRTGQAHLIWWQVLLPIYWLLIALATLLAFKDFALRPHHWFKSPHQVIRVPKTTLPEVKS
jgi:glycosyltransferase XagB